MIFQFKKRSKCGRFLREGLEMLIGVRTSIFHFNREFRLNQQVLWAISVSKVIQGRVTKIVDQTLAKIVKNTIPSSSCSG